MDERLEAAFWRGRAIAAEGDLAFARASAIAAVEGRPVSLQAYLDALVEIRRGAR